MNISGATTLLVSSMLFAGGSFAQPNTYMQYQAMPALINPAFTGSFDGGLRVGAMHSRIWTAITIPMVTYGISADAPLLMIGKSDYLAGGCQYAGAVAGDGNLRSNAATVAIAYHKVFAKDPGKSSSARTDLAIGLQAGFVQRDLGELSLLYISSIAWRPGWTDIIRYYPVNAGISLNHYNGRRFSYTLGISSVNINHPRDLLRSGNDNVNLGVCYGSSFSAEWQVSQRLTIKPFALYQLGSSYDFGYQNIVLGNEVQYSLGKATSGNYPVSLFASGCYQADEIIFLSLGMAVKRMRLAVSYNWGLDYLYRVGASGYEVSLQYIAPNFLHRKTTAKAN